MHIYSCSYFCFSLKHLPCSCFFFAFLYFLSFHLHSQLIVILFLDLIRLLTVILIFTTIQFIASLIISITHTAIIFFILIHIVLVLSTDNVKCYASIFQPLEWSLIERSPGVSTIQYIRYADCTAQHCIRFYCIGLDWIVLDWIVLSG